MRHNEPNRWIYKNMVAMRGLAIAAFLVSIIGIGSTVFAQVADVLAVPDAYKVEGIPPIKKSEVEKLFYDPASIRSNLIWDTDQKNRRLLVTDKTNNVYLLNSPLSEPTKLFDKIVPNTIRVNPNGRSVALTTDHEDEDNYQLYLYDFEKKETKKLITLTGKDESIDSFVWSKSGDSLFYGKVDYESKTSKLCKYNFRLETCFPAELRGMWNVLDTEGNKILLKYWKASSNQQLYVYDIKTQKLTAIDEKGNARKGFLNNGRAIWTSEGNELCESKPCILTLNLTKGNPKRLNLPENLSNFSDTKLSPDGKHLLVQESKDGIDDLRLFRIKKDKIVGELPPFINGSFVIWNTRWLSDNEVAYTLENIGKPTSIRSFDIKSRKYTDWTREKLPAQLIDKVKSPELIKWKSFDGKEISGYIVRPNTVAKKSPVLIYVHGGPQLIDRPTFKSGDIGLASNLGVTIIHTNIRGSSGFGDDFMDADNQEKRGSAIKDIQSLLDWTESQPDLDVNQIYLRGLSYGGFVVLATALREPTRIKGVIAESPLVSIRGYLAQDWIDEFAKNEYGDPKDEKLMSKLDELSPLNNTDRWNQIPLFLTRGKLDSRIPEKDVVDLKNQLQDRSSEVWFIYSNNSGHGFGSEYVTAAMFEFLKNQINKEK